MARLRPLWLSLPAIATKLRRARTLAVASDFDGTLTPIVERPEDAALDPRARRALHRLVRTPSVAVAVLSGRPLDDLHARLGITGAYLSGAAGLETEEPGGRRRVHLPPGLALPEGLRETLAEWCQRFQGAWVEDKGHSVALHYRSVPARFQPAFGAGVRRRIAPVRGKATLVHGKKVFEVMPAVPWNKGSALERWLQPRRGALPFYLGDDTHDEPAYGPVRERGGITVAVGRPVSKAEFGVADPVEVVWFLEWLAREWHARVGDGEGQ